MYSIVKYFNTITFLTLSYLNVKCPSISAQCTFTKDECPNESITFRLYKNATFSSGPLLLDPSNLKSADFEPLQKLIILLHGYNGNYTATPNAELLQPLLSTQNNTHVLSVDYKSLVPNPCYFPWAVQNARIIAKCIAQVINKLTSAGIYGSEDIHVIGFSIGAQIAGLSANHVSTKLSWITGLDPAGPIYDLALETERLDPTDAKFVDVIHTDPYFFGSNLKLGHVDFLPNPANLTKPPPESYIQNGCPPANIRCSHFRVAELYAESIISPIGFWAHPCNITIFNILSTCSEDKNSKEILMGFYVPHNASGTYVLKTNATSPYALGRNQGQEN